MIISFELETDKTENELKERFGYTDKVHRLIDGDVKEIDNPVSFVEYLTDQAKGHLINKINKTGSCC